MRTSPSSPRIYVACLASYNAGKLHGVWIDAALDVDAIDAEIRAMLFTSPEPNVFRCTLCHSTAPYGVPTNECACSGTWKPSAEEYAIHDTEGFGEYQVKEYSSLDDVSAVALAIEEHGDAFTVWLSHRSAVEEAIETFQEAYQGEWDSMTAFAEHLVDEGMLGEIPDALKNYIDCEAFARDLECGGDYFIAGGYVFRGDV